MFFKGEMSIVGPRPLFDDTKLFDTKYEKINVMPGWTTPNK